MFQVSVLGPIEVRRDGRIVPVPAGKTSELLVHLALEAGLFVRTDRLVDDLWTAGAVHTRRNTLQSKIAKLRRALGDPSVIVSGEGGYKLAVAPSEVDALALPRHAADASSLLAAGDDRGVADQANFFGYILWSGWLVAFAVLLLRRPRDADPTTTEPALSGVRS